MGILLQAVNSLVIVGQYYSNKDYIAKNLCENRDKPEMHCEGKCCLKKKLAKDAKEHGPTSRNQKSEQVNLFCSFERIEIKPVYFEHSTREYGDYAADVLPSIPMAVFHPPSV